MIKLETKEDLLKHLTNKNLDTLSKQLILVCIVHLPKYSTLCDSMLADDRFDEFIDLFSNCKFTAKLVEIVSEDIDSKIKAKKKE